LNALQAEAIAQAGTTQVRGRLRDAITVFDENAALFICHDTRFIDCLREHQWQRLFIEERAAFRQGYSVCLFGHALMEKLVSPYKAITAHAWPLVVPADRLVTINPASCDALLALTLSTSLDARTFMPLPILGLPDWDENQEGKYYEDSFVFRPAKKRL